MSSSKRWIDADSDADEAERSLLRAGLGGDPPPELEDEVLRRVLAVALLPAPLDPSAGTAAGPVASLPAGTAGAAATGAAAKAASTLALLGKGFVAGVGVSVAVAAGQHWVLHEPAHPPPAEKARPAELRPPSKTPRAAAYTPRIAPLAPSAAASAATGDVPEAKASAPRPLPRSGGPSRPALETLPPVLPEQAAGSTRPASQLEEEAALLKTARQQLRQGALAAAFATLETSRQRFTASELEQEREALMIELLYRSGQRAAAASRAAAFLQRHAESPHRGQVQKFAE